MPVIVLGLCIIFLSARLTIGIDLSDESYYAAFVDGWLKTGIEQSRNLMIHQTADFLIYPLALVFRAVNGGSDGLVLFLRLIYLRSPHLLRRRYIAPWCPDMAGQ